MSRRLVGHFRQSHPSQPRAPFLDAVVFENLAQRGLQIPFLIDTGADRSLLSAEHAALVYGEQEYQAISRSRSRIAVSGVGGDVSAIARPLYLLLFAEPDDVILIHREILMSADPRYRQRAATSHVMPSLLGRDILNQFTLTVSPPRGLIELLEEEGTSST